MHYSKNLIRELVGLRKRGYTLGQLVKKFSIPKTSLWHHIKDVPVPKKLRQQSSVVKSKKEWVRAEEEASRTLSGKLTSREKILIAVALYWGEGAKRDFNLANSDSELVRVFLQCMKIFGVNRNRFALHVRTFEDVGPEEAVAHWEKVTGISRVVKIEILRGKKNGKLPYGMCRIRLLKGGYHLKLIQSLHKKIAGIV